ncbi:MAG TPA: VWA-like domain-containing protein, partial [Candidatus Ozemobacteraceae bacterium]|nr:VWA-like domain-containing protein [Candidatus Ozemobacteraceae bacterium]
GGQGHAPCDEFRHLLPGRKARVPWERLLRMFAGQALAKDDYSLARPNKRYLDQDIVVPGLFSESLSLVVVSLDTSGSMDDETIASGLAEIAKLHDLAPEILLIVGDDDVHETIETQNLPAYVKDLRVKGGGGTSHLPVFRYIERNRLTPDLFIGITDLESCFPSQPPRYPVLWLVPTEHDKAPWGRVIEIE